LREQISRFNGFVATGIDAEFGRGQVAWSRSYGGDTRNANPNLGTLEPPFYGVRLEPTGSSSAGLLTSVDAEVIDQRGRRIAGLYACSDCVANIEYGVGFQAGLALGRNLISGLAAAKHIAARTAAA
jgi:3-oxosteroid 1-dehydrogenase